MPSGLRALPDAVPQPEFPEELVRPANATGHLELRRGTGVRSVDRDAKAAISLRVRDSQKDAIGRLVGTRIGQALAARFLNGVADVELRV